MPEEVKHNAQIYSTTKLWLHLNNDVIIRSVLHSKVKGKAKPETVNFITSLNTECTRLTTKWLVNIPLKITDACLSEYLPQMDGWSRRVWQTKIKRKKLFSAGEWIEGRERANREVEEKAARSKSVTQRKSRDFGQNLFVELHLWNESSYMLYTMTLPRHCSVNMLQERVNDEELMPINYNQLRIQCTGI